MEHGADCQSRIACPYWRVAESIPRRIRSIVALGSPEAPRTPPIPAQEADQRAKTRRRAALEASRPAHSRQVPHEQPQVDAADLHEQPFQDVGMPAQMDAAHPAGLVEMRVGPFQPFAPLPQQPFPARAADPPTVGTRRVPRGRLALPCTHIIRSGQLQHAPAVQCGSRWLRWTFVRNRAT